MPPFSTFSVAFLGWFGWLKINQRERERERCSIRLCTLILHRRTSGMREELQCILSGSKAVGTRTVTQTQTRLLQQLNRKGNAAQRPRHFVPDKAQKQTGQI
jgi:hypothetical protein